VQSTAQPTTTRPNLSLAVLTLVLFVTFLDNTIVAVALAPIQTDLHANITALQWVVSGYALTFAGLMLAFGTLGDHFGRRRVMLLGLGAFTAGSVLGAVSTTSGMLIGARVIMGVGAAASEPGTLSMIRQLYSDGAERARALGVWSAVSGFALAAGPVIGAALVGAWSWRAVFVFNVIAGLVALAGVAAVLPEFATPRRTRLDFAGFFWGAASLTAATFATIVGETQGYRTWWVDAMYIFAAGALVMFGLSERRASEPVLDLRCFRERAFGGGMLVAFTGFFAVFAVFFFIPLFIQLIGNRTSFQLVADFAPMAVTMIVASVLSGRWIARIGPAVPVIVGCALAGGGILVTNAYITATSGVSLFAWSLSIVGAGLGIVMVAATTSVLGVVPAERSGMAASAVNTSRELGAVAGVTVLGAIVNGELTVNLLHRLAKIPGLPASLREQVVVAVTTGTANTKASGIPKTPQVTAIVNQVIAAAEKSFSQGLDIVMLTAASLMLASGVVAAGLIRRRRAVNLTGWSEPPRS
jgi:EmrB/QacA subfamily drug resistance transporter